jgi:hypothetical protein
VDGRVMPAQGKDVEVSRDDAREIRRQLEDSCGSPSAP